jgi:hypothetical protein
MLKLAVAAFAAQSARLVAAESCEEALYSELFVATTHAAKCHALFDFKNCAAKADGTEVPEKLKGFEAQCQEDTWGAVQTREKRSANCGSGTKELNGRCVAESVYNREMAKLEAGRKPRIVTKDGGMELHVGGAMVRITNTDRDFTQTNSHGNVLCSGSGVQVQNGKCEPKVEFMRVGDVDLPVHDLATGTDLDALTAEVEGMQEELMTRVEDKQAEMTQLVDDQLEASRDTITEMQQNTSDIMNALRQSMLGDLDALKLANYKCQEGFGGEMCLSDVAAPVMDTSEIPSRVYLKGPKSFRLSAADVPEPTITDTGPGKLTGVTVELWAVSHTAEGEDEADDVEFMIASWESPNVNGEFDAEFDWDIAIIKKAARYTAKAGVTIVEYRAMDKAGNVATAQVDVQVGDADECQDEDSNSCDGDKATCTDIVGYKDPSQVPGQSTGTYKCACKKGYYGDGYTCKALPCINNSCKELKDLMDENSEFRVPTGEYQMCGKSDKVYCEMDLEGGGWTLVATINPTDGNSVGYRNSFWQDDNGQYGSFSNKLTHDYRSPAAGYSPGAEIMTRSVTKTNPQKQLAYRVWDMKPGGAGTSTWSDMFKPWRCQNCDHYSTKPCRTGNSKKIVKGTQSEWDDIIFQGNCIYTDVNPSGSGWGDTIRLTTTNHDHTDNQMSGFASCIDCGSPWQGGYYYYGLDRAPCNRVQCSHGNLKKMTNYDCRGNYCGGTYGGNGLTPWISHWFVR